MDIKVTKQLCIFVKDRNKAAGFFYQEDGHPLVEVFDLLGLLLPSVPILILLLYLVEVFFLGGGIQKLGGGGLSSIEQCVQL